MNLDDATIRDLIDLTDEVGVLSFYVGHTPSRAADPQPAAPIEIRNQLKALRTQLADGDRDVARAVENRVRAIDGQLEALFDPKSSGQGRALFVAVASGQEASLNVQVPFKERVIFDANAYVRPLVAALDEGRPAGILVASRHGSRLLRWSHEGAEVVEETTFVVEDQVFAEEKSGPAMANPSNPQHAHVDRDQFEDRLDENRARFFKEIVTDTAQRAESEGWDRLVVSGPPKLRDDLAPQLEAATSSRVLRAEQSWEDATPPQIASAVWPLLRSVHLDRERELVDSARHRAFSGGPGAVGLRNVCAALNEGRVAHLLYDVTLDLEGYVSDEGTLHPRVEGVVAESDVGFRRDRLFVERMLEKAISTSAAVTAVSDETAEPLREHEGVAALLRW